MAGEALGVESVEAISLCAAVVHNLFLLRLCIAGVRSVSVGRIRNRWCGIGRVLKDEWSFRARDTLMVGAHGESGGVYPAFSFGGVQL